MAGARTPFRIGGARTPVPLARAELQGGGQTVCARARQGLRDRCDCVVAHLGSGISVSAHENGRMIDVTNSREEGAFSTERAGGVPIMQLVDLCFSGRSYPQSRLRLCSFAKAGCTPTWGRKIWSKSSVASTRATSRQEGLRRDGLPDRERDRRDGRRACMDACTRCSSPAAWRTPTG